MAATVGKCTICGAETNYWYDPCESGDPLCDEFGGFYCTKHFPSKKSKAILALADYFLKIAKRKPWSKKPPGWKEKSVKQYSRTMMKGEEHPFTECVEKMKKHMDSPEAFCASVRDKFEGKKTWRNSSKLKKKKSSKK